MKLRKSLVNAAEYIQLFGSSTRDRHAQRIMLFCERPPIYGSLCMMISGERTEQLDIIAGFLQRHWLYE